MYVSENVQVLVLSSTVCHNTASQNGGGIYLGSEVGFSFSFVSPHCFHLCVLVAWCIRVGVKGFPFD